MKSCWRSSGSTCECTGRHCRGRVRARALMGALRRLWCSARPGRTLPTRFPTEPPHFAVAPNVEHPVVGPNHQVTNLPRVRPRAQPTRGLQQRWNELGLTVRSPRGRQRPGPLGVSSSRVGRRRPTWWRWSTTSRSSSPRCHRASCQPPRTALPARPLVATRAWTHGKLVRTAHGLRRRLSQP